MMVEKESCVWVKSIQSVSTTISLKSSRLESGLLWKNSEEKNEDFIKNLKNYRFKHKKAYLKNVQTLELVNIILVPFTVTVQKVQSNLNKFLTPPLIVTLYCILCHKIFYSSPELLMSFMDDPLLKFWFLILIFCQSFHVTS